MRAAPMAASPRIRARYRLPWPVVPLPFFFPADSLTPGANLAQEARCPAVGNRLISVPISAMMTAAAMRPMPGISSSRATASAKGAIISSIRASSSAMSASRLSTRATILASRNAW